MILTTFLINPLQRFLNNPLAVKMALLGVICLFLFLLGTILMRKIRQDIIAETAPAAPPQEGSPAFSLAAYNGVIQQLREKEKDLQRLLEKEQQRSASADVINEAVLANLASGVIFLDRMGGVRQANRAAKSLLGYASPLLFNFRDLFRTVAKVRWPDGSEANSPVPLVSALQQTIRDAVPLPRVEVEYRTPAGQKRTLGISAFPVAEKSVARNAAKDKETLGACCLIEDLTQITEIARQMHVSENLASMGEISAGLVQNFKTSLETIANHAQTLARARPGEDTRQLTEKIKVEAESLSKVVAEFLEFANSAKD
jgi:nitrogen fixation/metabolism regulation signal transduction histidine kinase